MNTVTSIGLTSAESAILVALVAGVVGAAAATLFGRWAEVTSGRRSTYAEAIQTLYAWAEYPFRIRRRTSDAPDELARLAALGHDLQERLRWHEAWIQTESRWMARTYTEVIQKVSRDVGPAASDAWRTPFITCASEMVLDSWGPVHCAAAITSLQRATSWRFGIRRVIGWAGLHP